MKFTLYAGPFDGHTVDLVTFVDFVELAAPAVWTGDEPPNGPPPQPCKAVYVWRPTTFRYEWKGLRNAS